ncbi:transcriptional regulator [Halobacteriales archaeon SW_7_68_16]|nr:MAG: transcriptional regulator [Halobacteriales archaeon SW_7_68_16]
MVIAYVMIKASTGRAETLRNAVAAIDGVEAANIVAGDVDIIARLAVDSPAAVKNAVATEVRGIDGVEDTQTYVAVD